MSKESLARATNSQDMGMEPGIVHDADRIAAMSGGDILGGFLLRFRESAQPQWGRRIVLILAKRIGDKHHLTRDIAMRTAVAALEEFHSPHCIACGGARVMLIDALKITCEACNGTGQQRFDDVSRRARIGTYGARIDAAMADAHKHMSASLGAYLGHAAGRLG